MLKTCFCKNLAPEPESPIFRQKELPTYCEQLNYTGHISIEDSYHYGFVRLLMLNTHFDLPPVPGSPLSVWQILNLGLNAYRGAFRHCMRLFWVPSLVLSLSSLPLDLVKEFSFTGQTLLMDVAVTAISCFGLFYYFWVCAVRGISLQRLLFSAEDSCVPSLAFANRLGWKSGLVRIVSFVFQFISVVGFIVVGQFAYEYLLDDSAPAEWAIAFIPIALLLLVASYFSWFWTEFFFATFGFVLVTEETGWSTMLNRTFKLCKGAFLRGSSFSLLLANVYVLCCVSGSPWVIVNLPHLLKDSEAPISKTMPFYFFNEAVLFSIDLLLVPFLIICAAYFSNDVRLRFELKRAGATK